MAFVDSGAFLLSVCGFLWLIILHIPREIAAQREGNEWNSVFEALAISGIAFMIAALPTTQPLPVSSRAAKAQSG